MKRALLPFLVFAAALSAETVSVSFNSVSNPVTVPGMNGAEAGPYVMDVNGNLVPGMCMDDFLGVNGTWMANVTNAGSSDFSLTALGNGGITYDGYHISSSLAYGMEAYLFSQIILPNADQADLQLAAWSIMDLNTLSNLLNSNNTAAETDLYDAYEAVTNPDSGFNPGNYEILTDLKGQNQEYIVASPEPSTYMLLGSGLLIAGMLGVRRRKQSALAAN